MSNHLSKHSLLIVSDTGMWQIGDQVHVFEPVLREVEWLATIFKDVTWIGFNHGLVPRKSSRPTSNKNIKFVLLPKARGGKTIFEKIKILPHVPLMIWIVYKYIRQHRYIHSRGPSVPSLISVLISCTSKKRFFWHKYAGNWIQDDSPWTYELQKKIMRKCGHIITVNGSWPNEPETVISFENPCLTLSELANAGEALSTKRNDLKTICFVGAMTPNKGISEFLESLPLLTHKNKVCKIYIAGDGLLRSQLEEVAAQLDFEIVFLGSIQREQLNQIYTESDILILPSQTEGFPKVIAEASAFGCVPIVTDMSALSQYILSGQNGLLLKNRNKETIASAIDILLDDFERLRGMASEVTKLAPLFTYERYCSRVADKIFPK